MLERLTPMVCEATGIALTTEKHPTYRVHPFVPSIDRVHPAVGYTPENCRVVCFAYNMAKGEWDEAVVQAVARALLERETV